MCKVFRQVGRDDAWLVDASASQRLPAVRLRARGANDDKLALLAV